MRLEKADLRSERAYFRLERADFRHERADFRLERADFGPERGVSGLRGLILGLRGGTNGRTNELTDERKSPCVLQDIVTFGTAAINTNIRLDNFSLKPETKVLGQIAIFRASEPI